MMRFLVVIVGVVAGLMGVVWFVQTSAFVNFTDRTPPYIEIPAQAIALGPGAAAISVRVRDEGSGVYDLSARLKQDARSAACAVGAAIVSGDEVKFSVTCDSVQAALRPGPATVHLAASDKSFWANKAEIAFSAEVDFSPPQIDVLSAQHLVQSGGSELVLFRVHDESAVSATVELGKLSFPSFSARSLDPSFPEHPKVFASIFALPLDWSSSDVVRIRAEDRAGNVAEVPLRFRSRTAAIKADRISISQQFIEEKVQPLVRSYELSLKRSGDPDADLKIAAIPNPEDAAGRFRVVNDDYRNFLNRELEKIFLTFSPERYWQGVFLRPMAAKLSSNFGDKRTYVLDGAEVGQSVHNGFDMASTEREVVRASNEGIVRLAEDFGIYGNTIVVDHGLGVTSLYGHLSVMQVKRGDRVLKGDIIGHTGVTGFAAGDHLHFELRVGPVSVTPIEWWDPKWYQDDIEGKVSETKLKL